MSEPTNAELTEKPVASVSLEKEKVTSGRYSHHVFICGHIRPKGSERDCCTNNGSMDVLREMKTLVRQAGLKNVKIQKAGCLSICGKAITCVVYPEGVWYSLSGNTDELQKIISQHLQGGKPVRELFLEV
ncbi:MAG TPA: (2Fe-2S) ferredoxin domain-containing protein [Candidatus Poseidoniales archaeon]|jgi:(2Fe-2S) ferredoxin|nr:MAG: ferredoxin [Euryarchaeota archaeon]HIG03869.1 (2Fe-2S) ferredoxin domain-containing protein [Candidatus Poseidoniales archaeon]HIK79054.1 (2Fe-2S) ferredoxin domain-containing protein [Candidatus Poseidoniales archaeon]